MTVPPTTPPGDTPPPPPPPGATPPPSMPPMPPTGGAPAQPTNGLAVASLISSLVFCLGALSGITAIILGVLGRKKAKEMNGAGEGMATAGIIIGAITTVLSLIWIVILILGVATATTTTNSISKSIDKANKEIAKSQKKYDEEKKRNGDKAKASDYDVTAPDVQVGSYGYVTYKAYLENKADFDSSYTVKVRCVGDKGDSDTQTTYVYSLASGDKSSITTYSTLDSATVTAQCAVTSVVYGTT